MSPHFGNPLLLHGLWIVAALFGLGAVRLARGASLLRKFADAPMLAVLAPGLSTARAWARLLCVSAALALLVIAAADPRWGQATVEAKRRGLDVVFALDLSRSMLAADARPNRLERAKLLISDVVERLPGERIGLVGFAGDAVIACPLTLNHDTFRHAMETLDVRDPRRGGSMLAEAALVAGDCFVDAAPEGKVIIIVSDGEDQGEGAVDAAELVRRERGARIFTVGIGDIAEGARIPVGDERRAGWLMHDGQEVWTKMDPELLEGMAKAADGSFLPVGVASADASGVLQRLIVENERRAIEGATIRQWIPRFQWFALPALALLVVECLIGPRRASRPGERRVRGAGSGTTGADRSSPARVETEDVRHQRAGGLA